jgi:hypothetical protein
MNTIPTTGGRYYHTLCINGYGSGCGGGGLKNERRRMMITFSKEATIGEMYGPAMEITDQKEADEYFEACVIHCMLFNRSKEEAEKIQRINLGYYAGHYDSETMARVNRLFKTAHPIFGDTIPTPEEALDAGRKLAQGE